MSRTLDPLTDSEILTYARGMVTGEHLVADLNDPDWQSSLMLLLGGLTGDSVPTNIGLVLVPKEPHMRGFWLNNKCPGATVSAVMIPVESVEALIDTADTMYAALHPDETPS